MTTYDTAERAIPRGAGRFLLYAFGWNVVLFGLLRLAWTQHAITPLVDFQRSVVMWYGIVEHHAIVVDASCSGADLMALCAGVTLAYPAVWRRRLAGAAGGLALILFLNMLRIASLYLVASDTARFNLLHLYVWPLALVLSTVAYTVTWIWWSDRRSVAGDPLLLRFGLFAVAAFAVYAASVPWAFQSSALVDVGAWTATVGGWLLSALGVSAHWSRNVLFTGRGSFQITPECLFTPIIPLYGAALCTVPLTRNRRMGYLLLALPLFFGLGVARLLVLALPTFVAASPMHLVHGFYQIVAGSALLVGAAHWATRRSSAGRSFWTSAAVLATTLAVGLVAATPWRTVVEWVAAGLATRVGIPLLPLAGAADQQGALALMPGYQLAITVGLWLALTGGRAWRALGLALGCLLVSQIAFVAGVAALHANWGITPHAVVVRGWALGVPAIIGLFWISAGGVLVDGPPAVSDKRNTRSTPPTTARPIVPSTGVEYVVDAYGCDAHALRSAAILRAVINDVIESLGLTPLGEAMWHVFPGEGGVTGITMLAESHLSVHTYPEIGFAAFDLYCCRPHGEWPWKEKLASALGAREVKVRLIRRG
jgi:S-adenosylmethionine decarboxylase